MYKEIPTLEGEAFQDTTKYAQIEYVVTPQRWKDIALDVQAAVQ